MHFTLSTKLRSKHIVSVISSPLPASPPHLTTWQSFSGEHRRNGDDYQGRSPGIKSGQMQKSQERETVLNSSMRLQGAITTPLCTDGWTTAQPRPCLLSCFTSYPLLFLWIKSTESVTPLCFPPAPPSLSVMSVITCTYSTQIAKADVHRAGTEG